jgi:glycosyltransferase involved in cell wall biosynthesis
MSAPPLRIGLFLNPLFGWQGGKEYARNLLLSLQAYQSEDRQVSLEVHLFAGRSIPDASLDEFRSLAHGIHRHSHDFHKSPQSVLGDLKRQRIDFAFPIHNTGLGSIHTADWIYDFQHKHLPHFFSNKDIRERDRSFSRMFKYAGRVIVSSETSREDLQKFYPGNDQIVRVLPFTTFPKSEWVGDDPGPTLRRYHLPRRFFLLCSQFWVHKNHAVVFQAIKKMLDQGIETDVVCTGSLNDYRKPAHMDEMLAYLHFHGIYPRVRLMGLMPRFDQIQLMRCALAVIQPSLFEGWSTVLEDARTFGKHTLCSSLPVHREQNLPGAEFFAPTDADELAGLMIRAWKSNDPGFDPKREALALAKAKERAVVFARQFLSIAAEPASPNQSHLMTRGLNSLLGNVRSSFRKKSKS